MKIAINTLALYKTKVGMGRYIVELVNRVPVIDSENKYIIYLSKKNRKHFTAAPNVSFNEVPAFFTIPFLKIIWEHFFLPLSLLKNKVDLYHATGFVLPWKPQKIKYVVTLQT
ncbi:MAG: hypothetical protein AABX82_07670 [Nanoarchaeota archaeon]